MGEGSYRSQSAYYFDCACSLIVHDWIACDPDPDSAFARTAVWKRAQHANTQGLVLGYLAGLLHTGNTVCRAYFGWFFRCSWFAFDISIRRTAREASGTFQSGPACCLRGSSSMVLVTPHSISPPRRERWRRSPRE